MNGTKTMEQKAAQPTAEKKPLSMWKVILTVIGAIYLLSLVIPAGEFARNGRIAIPGT